MRLNLPLAVFSLGLLLQSPAFAKSGNRYEFVELLFSGVSIHRLQIEEAHLIWEEDREGMPPRVSYPILEANPVDITKFPPLALENGDVIQTGTYLHLKVDETHRMKIIIGNGESGRRYLIQMSSDIPYRMSFKLIGASPVSPSCAGHLISPSTYRRN